MTIKEISNKYLVPNYARQDVVLVKGKGSLLYDEDGNEYIDFGAGIAVNGLGISPDEWAEEVINQIKTLPHASNLYYSQPQALLAEKLCNMTG